jgi:chorismate mutase
MSTCRLAWMVYLKILRILLHVHTLLDNGLVNKLLRRQILHSSVARLRNNSDSKRSVFSVIRAMFSARQENYKQGYNNGRCSLCLVRAEGLYGLTWDP